MSEADNLKTFCESADTLQDVLRRFPDETELLAAVRAVGMPDPAAFLKDVRSVAVARQSRYVLVPALWNAGDLGGYRAKPFDDTSLFALDQQLVRDAMLQSELFHEAGDRFMDYLSLWAQERNRRGDEMFQRYSCEDKKLTRGLARFVASLDCAHTIIHDSLKIEELLGTPFLQSHGSYEETDRAATVSLAARLADIKLNGTFVDRLKAEIGCSSAVEEGSGQDADLEIPDAVPPSGPWPHQVEIEGQRFYPAIEAQELGSALYLAGLIAQVSSSCI